MKKRILSILLTLCMVLCLVPITVFAAGGAKAILPGTSAQSILKIDQSRLSFAGHEWWVIGQKTDKSNNAPIITLIAVNNDFGDVPFRTGSAVPFENARRYSEDNGYYANNPSDMSQWRKPNEYAGSTLQQKMVSLAEAIPEKEQAVIRPKDITEGITGQEVKSQKLWAFSQEDSIYLYRNSCKYAAKWWTRSSNEVYGYGSWTIHPDGRSGSALNVDYDAAVRPAMELDLSSVLFISAAEHGKVADLTTPIAEYAGDEWKLTLHDSDRDDFTAKTVLVNGSVLEVEYKNAKVGDNEYISAVIKDADGSISRYTRVVQLDGTTNGTRGRAAIDLTGIDMTGKTLCVFNEQFNGDHKTDYAGALREVKLTYEIDEQFTLTPGGRYYFDLSAMNIPGTVNSNLPDKTLHYVPFTYVGTVDAYSMENETDTAKQPYEHSLFIADYNVKCSLQRETLAEMNLIYGQTYTASNVNYTLRAPSVGDHHRNEGEGSGLAPIDNEWDTIYQKSADYIKNWYKMRSFGQDIGTGNVEGWYLSRGGHFAAQVTFWARPTLPERDTGFRPVLEVLNPGTLGPDGLKAVTLDLGGGTLGNSSEDIQIIVKNGESFTAPATEGLSRPNSISEDAQLYWSDENGNCYKPGDTVPADVSRLLITGDYEVIYLPGTYGTGSAVTDMKPHNNILTLRGALFTRTGYTQTGWATVDGGEKVYGFGDIYAQNAALTLYPVWNANQYTVTFDSTGGSEVITKTIDVTYGEPLGDMPVPKREGYVFLGWYDALVGGKCYGDSDGKSTSPYDKDVSITLYAQWAEAPSRMVYFNTCGGTMTGPVEVLHKLNTPIAKPDNPTKPGHTFNGWYTDSALTQAWNFDDWVTGELKLYAGWTVNQYTITFDTAGGSTVAPITQDYGTAITVPSSPTREGYTFIGWDKEIPATMPAENMTITAKWAINKYTIRFNTDGGTYIFPITADYGSKIHNPGTLYKPGFIFDGWDRPYPETMPAENITLTAKWKVCDHSRSNQKASCKDAVKCSVCKGFIDIAEHTPSEEYKSDGSSHWHVCTVCGEKLDQAEHTGGKANCHEKAKCDICHAPYGEVDTSAHHGGKATCSKKAVCDECGKEYGNFDPANHAEIIKVNGKTATAATFGTKEHYKCSGCGKLFSDGDGKTEVTAENLIIGKLPPKITEGDGNRWVESSEKPLAFRSDAAFEDFTEVLVDGEKLSSESYAKFDDGIKIELLPEYLGTLSEGAHTITIRSEWGEATAEFSVEKTAAAKSLAWLRILIVIIVTGGGVTAYVIIRKKKNSKKSADK